MSMYKSQIETKQIPPNSSECSDFAWGKEKKESDLVPTKTENQLEVQIVFSWKISSKEWSDHKEHLESCKKDLKIAIGYDPIHTMYMLNGISYPTVTSYKIS